MQYPQVQHPTPPHPVIVSGQPQTIFVQSNAPAIYQNYKSKQSTALGAIQICVGSFCVIVNVMLLIFEDVYGPSIVGYGIWSGVFFILAGSFGISAAKLKTKCMIITSMALSIISAFLALVVLALSATGWVVSYRPYRQYTSIHGMYGTMVFLAILGGVAAIWSSAICCAAVCCGPSQLQGQVIEMNPQGVQYVQPGVQSQVMYVTSPGAGYAAMQPQPGQGTPQYMATGGCTTEPNYKQDESLLPPPYEPPPPAIPAEEGEMAVKTSL